MPVSRDFRSTQRAFPDPHFIHRALEKRAAVRRGTSRRAEVNRVVITGNRAGGKSSGLHAIDDKTPGGAVKGDRHMRPVAKRRDDRRVELPGIVHPALELAGGGVQPERRTPEALGVDRREPFVVECLRLHPGLDRPGAAGEALRGSQRRLYKVVDAIEAQRVVRRHQPAEARHRARVGSDGDAHAGRAGEPAGVHNRIGKRGGPAEVGGRSEDQG